MNHNLKATNQSEAWAPAFFHPEPVVSNCQEGQMKYFRGPGANVSRRPFPDEAARIPSSLFDSKSTFTQTKSPEAMLSLDIISLDGDDSTGPLEDLEGFDFCDVNL